MKLTNIVIYIIHLRKTTNPGVFGPVGVAMAPGNLSVKES